MKNSRFQRGSGVYTCRICSKQTRETGQSESGAELCAKCYEMSGDENSVADRVITEQEFFERWNTHSRYYKEETELLAETTWPLSLQTHEEQFNEEAKLDHEETN